MHDDFSSGGTLWNKSQVAGVGEMDFDDGGSTCCIVVEVWEIKALSRNSPPPPQPLLDRYN